MAIDREKLEAQSSQLRQELKHWEKRFAKSSTGKPSRDDIKSDPVIGMYMQLVRRLVAASDKQTSGQI